MLFQVEKSLFQDSLEKVVRATGKTSSDESLNCVLIDVTDGKVTLTCTDIITTIKASFTCMDFENGQALVDAKFLLSYVKALPSQELLIRTEKENKSISIISGKSKSSILYKDIKNFPIGKAVKEDITLNVISEELKKALKEVLFAVAQDETRPILTGVLFEVSDGKLTLVGLDGYRMAVSSIPVDCEESISSVIPQKSAMELQRILESNEENVTIKISKSRIEFVFNSIVINSVPLEGTYVKYRSIIPENDKAVCTINRQCLLSLLNRASAILTEKSKLVKLAFSNDSKLTLSAASSLGKANEELKLEDFQGSELNIAFNLKYLSDILLSLEDDELEFRFSNNISPLVVKKKESSDYIGIVLPVRLVSGGEN